MSTSEVTILVIVIVVVLLLVGAAVFLSRRRALRSRFGPEYDRVVAEQDSRSAAERELRERERRHAELELRPLDPASRERYVRSWEEIQVRFVDEPRGAVEDADALVATVMQRLAEGFASERERLEAQWGRGEDISTEDLRVALQRYRSFFQRLLAT